MMTNEIINEQDALDLAVKIAMRSPCQKSKRGVVIFNKEFGIVASGFNRQPYPFGCTKDDACQKHCNKLCLHAEMIALDELTAYRAQARRAFMAHVSFELLHVKAIDGKAIPSGPPSCWQCSRLILNANVQIIWILQDNGLSSYTALEFHRLTLKNCDILSA